MWFDSSIWFSNSSAAAIEQKILQGQKDALYFIRTAQHDIASFTHPGMYGYFPSDYLEHLGLFVAGVGIKMHMAGAMILYHTEELKHKILKWAYLCALTQFCISPLGSQKGCAKEFKYLYTQNSYHTGNNWTQLSESRLIKIWDRKSNPDYDPGIHYFCHRFDQSLMSILLANQENYSFRKVEIFVSKDPGLNFATVYRTADYSVEYSVKNRRLEQNQKQANYLTFEQETALREKVFDYELPVAKQKNLTAMRIRFEKKAAEHRAMMALEGDNKLATESTIDATKLADP